MSNNRISHTLPVSDINEVMNAVNTIKQKLPFLLSLTSDERRSQLKPGDRGRVFATTALEIGVQNPEILPPVFSLEEMRKDVELLAAFQPILLALTQLQAMAADTDMVLTAEAYTAGLDLYSFAKASNRVSSTSGPLAELRRMMGRRGGSSSTTSASAKTKE
ncbi:MAG: hypothetical protein ACKV2V_01210 [Blastocatellia bacterium]